MPERNGPRVLVFGATGQVAQELARAKWESGTELTFLDRSAADLSRPRAAGGIVRSHRPDAVIIAAAYTAVDRAESEEELASTVNADAPGAIAAAAADISVPIVLFSTDYVFDGRKGRPYTESDPPNPINAYGRSKLAGEHRVRTANPRHVILRTSWVYSTFGANFLKTMVRSASRRDVVRVIADQKGCPTSAEDLAQAVPSILSRLLRTPALAGTYHLAGASETSWHGFAEAIFAELRARGMHTPLLLPIKTGEYPTRAERPRNSVLSGELIAAIFGIQLPPFQSALPLVLNEVLNGNTRK